MGVPDQQLFHTPGENTACGLANDETDILQQTADLVPEIPFDPDKQRPAVEHGADLVTGQALDPDLLVPTRLHDPGQAQGIVPIGLVYLHR